MSTQPAAAALPNDPSGLSVDRMAPHPPRALLMAAAPEHDSAPDILGTRISFHTAADLQGAVCAAVQERRPTVFIGLYAAQFRMLARDLGYRDLVRRSVTYPDGFGVTSELRRRGFSLAERVPTTDFVHPVAKVAADRGWRIGLYGAAPGVAARAAQRLADAWPGVEIVAVWDGYGERLSIPDLEAERLDLLFVGLGAPAQEVWAHEVAVQAGVPAILTSGGLFDFLAGGQPRAPMWMQRAGLEWAYRVLREPRRLVRRYLLGNAYFIRHTWLERRHRS